MATLYEETFEAWRKEVRKEELQPLRTGFYKELSNYVKRLKEAQRNLDPKSLKAIIIDEELTRLDRIVLDLLDKRLEKLLKTQGQINDSTLETPEKWANDEIRALHRQFEKLKTEILQGHVPSETPGTPKQNLLVRFVKEIPSIIGVDLKTHGPFLKEDVALLPYDNAEHLIRQGAAVEIRPSTQDNE
jgi:DNA replication initiation complex subunit (GINS family)